ncbi:MAG: DUF2141 domain-containing protein [Cyanobacteria bacterium P01_D01_bin.50]
MSTDKALSLLSNNKKCKGSLEVKILGIKKKQGQICLSLFNSKQGFPNNENHAIETCCIKVTDTQVTINFSNLESGSYAVALFHDENNDGVLNFNWLGIPIEGFGFSNNPRILKGIPKFEDSAVIVEDSETNIEIKLKYIF